ncbi:ATP-binding protein [Hydrogenophaga sp. NFH-34]|uniref:ATP-binding protein n=1 Tax=Hydrogenophaga sp. NFH-34 TaxID=2744446 RepID=UPI001F265D8C|nr:ATP-binding protein [Hydrogenophaga sp. NFH-34]
MSLIVSKEILLATSNEKLKRARERVGSHRSDEDIQLLSDHLDKDALTELLRLACDHKQAKLSRTIEVILQALEGDFSKPVPNFNAFKEVLTSYIRHEAIDGWIYVERSDGQLLPELVTDISYHDGYRRDSTPSVSISTISYTMADGHGSTMDTCRRTHTFHPNAVARKRVDSILESHGILKESERLKAEYQAAMDRHHGLEAGAFSKQFRATGPMLRKVEGYGSEGFRFNASRVIWDLDDEARGSRLQSEESVIFEKVPDHDGHGNVPEHPLAVAFDMECQESFWVNTCHLMPYDYDKSLGSKLILPETHRDLLDVLTTDIGAFTGDIIEGKSAGNIILCKGIPGVGKTLTAEVYAELIEKPLYKVHSGSLGTTAEAIERNLKVIFNRARRWNCVLLLDECDVFVSKRGTSIEQNAIVAEFLRTLEYFDGLIFMTTNRPDDIDEAFLSRCAAIIDYSPPFPADARKIWSVIAAHFDTTLDTALVEQLLKLFPQIAPRDIKMLLRLVLRMAKKREQPLSIDLFRQCAMFRAIDMTPLEGAR